MNPLPLVCAVVAALPACGQEAEKSVFRATLLAPLEMSVLSAAELDKPTVVPRAVLLQRSAGTAVSATLEFREADAGLILTRRVQLRPSPGSGNAPGAAVRFSAGNASTLPPGTSSGADGAVSDYYDLVIEPIGYELAPGTYSFALTFTEIPQ